MKVLQINVVCGVGSHGRIATDIHGILIKEGHESYIAFGRDKPKNCTTSIKIGSLFGVYLHGIKTRIFDEHGFGSTLATLHFIKKVKRLKPDVIHFQNIHGYYINVEILFSYLKKAGIPIIWTLQDSWSFTGHCAHFEYAHCDKWVRKCYDCPEKHSYPKSLCFDNSKRNYTKKKRAFTNVKNLTLVTPSFWLSQLVKQSFLQEYPVKLISTGIDLNVFKPTDSSIRKDYAIEHKHVILGVASVWRERKGFDYFIKMAELLNDNEIIILVGVTEAQQKVLPKNIYGIAKTNNVRELAAFYTCADVFVTPTLEDTFPTTNIESLACGTPVVTFKTGGSPEAVDENTDFVCDQGDGVALLSAARSFMPKSSKVSLSCVKRAQDLFNKNDRFREYIDLYKEVIKKEHYSENYSSGRSF